jgi:hypothetical protein
VYYPRPFMPDRSNLAMIALVFDKIHFPNVEVPQDRFDEVGTLAEMEKLRARGIKEERELYIHNMMVTAISRNQLGDLCEFHSTKEAGLDEKDVLKRAWELETLYYGPPEENFFPSLQTGISYGVAGLERGFWIPGPFVYPSAAVLFAEKRGLPLLHDDPRMPLLPDSESDSRPPVSHLAALIALRTLSVALPGLGNLTHPEIGHLREEVKELMGPFRTEMVKFTWELHNSLKSCSDAEEVQYCCDLLVRSKILPAVEDIKSQIKDSSRPYYHWFKDMLQGGVFTAAFYQQPVVAFLSGIFPFLVSGADVARKKEKLTRSPLYFVIKAQNEITKLNKPDIWPPNLKKFFPG